MKIGVVCYPSYGGSGVVATELGKRMAARGHEVHFISYDRPFKLNTFEENIYFHESEVIDYPLFQFPPYILALASKIAEVAKYAELDLVHVHYLIPHTIAAFLARQLIKERRLPIITTLHGTDITVVGHEPQFLDMTKFGIEVSDIVTAVSKSLAEDTSEFFDADKNIEVIYNFVNPEEYKKTENKCLQKKFRSNSDKVFIHISNFRPVKRIKDVIDIFAKVNQVVSSKLIFVGDGPEAPVAHKYLEQLGLSDKVYFMGKQERVTELLSVADICLLPSEKESFGLVALEAMACGVPVIASNAGGIPEVVTHGETGYLSPVGDVDSMAKHAITVLKDTVLWQQMSVRCKEKALHQFNMDQIVDQYEECYRRLL